VDELNKTTLFGLVSSCKHMSKVVTVKVQLAVFPLASVAVHVTVVVPIGNDDPLGGLQTAVTPGQLSPIVGGG
jgi:hypothetical protein